MSPFVPTESNEFSESGGFGDHVTPFHSPPNTPGDWIQDPLGLFGDVYVGPGKRSSKQRTESSYR